MPGSTGVPGHMRWARILTYGGFADDAYLSILLVRYGRNFDNLLFLIYMYIATYVDFRLHTAQCTVQIWLKIFHEKSTMEMQWLGTSYFHCTLYSLVYSTKNEFCGS